jgi:hypothetical protein
MLSAQFGGVKPTVASPQGLGYAPPEAASPVHAVKFNLQAANIITTAQPIWQLDSEHQANSSHMQVLLHSTCNLHTVTQLLVRSNA